MSTDSESSIDWLESDHEEDSDRNEEDSDRNEEDSDREEDRAESPAPPSAPAPRPTLKRQRSPQTAPPSTSHMEQLFSRKCAELQCYIRPLSLILNGLRSGRYRERLSTFQESVAMDRIQRIMGVLQNPCLGDKYINIILKMEEMLKSWFPHVQLPPRAAETDDPVPSKKSKLCPSLPVGPFTDTDSGPHVLRVTDLTPPGAHGAVKWLHTSPLCSTRAQLSPAPDLTPQDLTPQDLTPQDLTQDCAVSSTTDSHTEPRPRGPPLGKISAPCLEKLLKATESIITQRMDGSS